MVVALLASLALAGALFGAAPAALAQSADPAVRVWLSRSDDLRPGDRVRVYVRTRADGYLLILHAEPDGRVRVLFPLDPYEDSFVRGAEDLEVRGRGDRDAFHIYERRGEGMVYAAFSRDPFRFDEFVRGDHWDYRLLDTWRIGRDADAEAELTALAQRMAPDHFDYDLVRYTVGPRVAYRSYVGPYLGVYGGSCYGWPCWPYDGFRLSIGIGFRFGDAYPLYYPYYRRHRFYAGGFCDPFYWDPFYCDGFFFGAGVWFYDPFYWPRYAYWYDPFWYDPFWYRGGYWYNPFWYRPYRYASSWVVYRSSPIYAGPPVRWVVRTRADGRLSLAYKESPWSGAAAGLLGAPGEVRRRPGPGGAGAVVQTSAPVAAVPLAAPRRQAGERAGSPLASPAPSGTRAGVPLAAPARRASGETPIVRLRSAGGRSDAGAGALPQPTRRAAARPVPDAEVPAGRPREEVRSPAPRGEEVPVLSPGLATRELRSGADDRARPQIRSQARTPSVGARERLRDTERSSIRIVPRAEARPAVRSDRRGEPQGIRAAPQAAPWRVRESSPRAAIPQARSGGWSRPVPSSGSRPSAVTRLAPSRGGSRAISPPRISSPPVRAAPSGRGGGSAAPRVHRP